jgi:hypothetical protein
MRRSRRLSTSLISSRIEPRLHADLEDGPGGEESVFTELDKVNRASHIRRSSSRPVCVDDFVTLRRQRSEGCIRRSAKPVVTGQSSELLRCTSFLYWRKANKINEVITFCARSIRRSPRSEWLRCSKQFHEVRSLITSGIEDNPGRNNSFELSV